MLNQQKSCLSLPWLQRVAGGGHLDVAGQAVAQVHGALLGAHLQRRRRGRQGPAHHLPAPHRVQLQHELQGSKTTVHHRGTRTVPVLCAMKTPSDQRSVLSMKTCVMM